MLSNTRAARVGEKRGACGTEPGPRDRGCGTTTRFIDKNCSKEGNQVTAGLFHPLDVTPFEYADKLLIDVLNSFPVTLANFLQENIEPMTLCPKLSVIAGLPLPHGVGCQVLDTPVTIGEIFT